MESPHHECARLVQALEDLADQEAACVRMHDFATVIELQGRAAPIVAHLAARGPAAADAAIRQRLSEVIRRREETAAQIQVQLERTREQLDAVQSRRRRVDQIAPVYGRNASPRGHLSVIG